MTSLNMPKESNPYPLDLIEFFDNFDPGDPYMRAAISELQESLPKELLMSDSRWFITWSQAGKRRFEAA